LQGQDGRTAKEMGRVVARRPGDRDLPAISTGSLGPAPTLTIAKGRTLTPMGRRARVPRGASSAARN